MPPKIKSRMRDFQALFFGSLTIVGSVFTVQAVVRGHDEMQILLLGMLTVYAFSITLNAIVQIPHLEQYAAIPLGVTGTVVYFVGVPTDLPIIFIFLGVTAIIDLIWDPTRNVYDDRSGSS